MYQVIGKDGQVYGPVGMDTLQSWINDGRLERSMMMIDPISGQTQPAPDMLAKYDLFPAPVPPVLPPVMSSPQMVTVVHGTEVQRMGSVPQPDSALLGARLGGYLIDFIVSLPLFFLALIPLIGLIFAPLLALYWLSRDALFGGQSLGKKAVGLRVVRQDG